MIVKVANRASWQTLFVWPVALCFGLLLQTGCLQLPAWPQQPLELYLYFDASIVWPADDARRRLAEEIIAAIKAHPLLSKIKVIELGSARKASENFSRDFDLGPPVLCDPPLIPKELRGNREAERRAQELADAICARRKEERVNRLAKTFDELTALLLQPAKALTKCTSFADLVSRLQQDAPNYALIVTDGRANCREALGVYQPRPASRLVVLQCPDPERRTAERTAQLKQMLPEAEMFMLPQAAQALQWLIAPESLEELASTEK